MAIWTVARDKDVSLSHNILWNTAGSFFYLGCQWLTTVFVVTLSSNYSDSGLLAFAMAVGNIFAPIALYKIRAFQASDVKGEYAAHDYVAFRIATIIVGALVAIIYTSFVNEGPSSFAVVLAYLLFKADESFSDVFYGVEQKAQRMDLIGISQIIRGVISLGTFVIVLLAGPGLLWATLAMAGGCILITFVFDIPNAHEFERLAPVSIPERLIKLARTCLPAVIASVAWSAVVSVSRQYFGVTAGNDALGIYAAVATPAIFVQVAVAYLSVPFIGPLATSWSFGRPEELHNMLKKALLTIFIGAGASIIVLALIGPWLLVTVYGESIAPYTYQLVPLLVCTTLAALVSFLTDVFIAFRDFTSALTSNIVPLAICLCAMVPCIGTWGMMGVNITIIASYAAGACIGILRLVHDVRSVDGAEDESASAK